MKKKRLFFLIESLSGGGAEKVLMDLVSKLDKSRFDVTVATIVNSGVYIEEIRKHCDYYSLLPSPNGVSTFFGKFFYKLRYKLIYHLPPSLISRWVIKGDFDIEVGFIEGFATKVVSHSRNQLSKKIAWVHVDPVNQNYADNYYRDNNQQIKSYKKFDTVVCVSENVKKAFKEKFQSVDNVIVKYNPVDKQTIIDKSNESWNFKKSDRLLIGTVGRLTDIKGYNRLLKVVQQLLKDGINLELWILGDGEQKESLKKYIHENNLENRVRLLGFQNNPYKFIKNFNLFVCSSKAEGFSLAIAEAITLGIPVVSTNCAGPNELLNFGEFGMVVENNDQSLYLGIKELISNQELLNHYKFQALERQEIFNIDSAIKEIEDIFN